MIIGIKNGVLVIIGFLAVLNGMRMRSAKLKYFITIQTKENDRTLIIIDDNYNEKKGTLTGEEVIFLAIVKDTFGETTS